jgi:PAN domain/Bacterial Ig domain
VTVTSGYTCHFSFNPTPPLSVVSNDVTASATHGTVRKIDNNNWTYTSNPGFKGTDYFTMTRIIYDPGAKKRGTVVITYQVNVLGASAPAGSLEPGVNRPGLDYRNFELATPDPRQCAAACTAEAQCRAFTYVNPGVQGAKARCWLKSAIPAASPNNCCTSGVIRP